MTVPVVLECHETQPQVVARQLHRALARLICDAQAVHASSPCSACMAAVEPLVRPVAHALFVAASGEEHPLAFEVDPKTQRGACSLSHEQFRRTAVTVEAMYDRYERVGHALEVIGAGGLDVYTPAGNQ